LRQQTHTTPRDSTRIAKSDRDDLQPLIDAAIEAIFVLAGVSLHGPGWHPIGRAVWSVRLRLRPSEEKDMLEEFELEAAQRAHSKKRLR
jgi:hypothetical protein